MVGMSMLNASLPLDFVSKEKRTLPEFGDFDYGLQCVCGAVMVAANCSWVDCVNPYCEVSQLKESTFVKDKGW
jgi:hypothetical protein